MTAVREVCAVFDNNRDRAYTDRVILEMARSCSKSFEELEQEIKQSQSQFEWSENNDLSD